MGNAFNKPVKKGEAATAAAATTSTVAGVERKKCTSCKCSASGDAPAAHGAATGSSQDTASVISPTKSIESATKDGTSSMIVLHSDTPSESFVSTSGAEALDGEAPVVVTLEREEPVTGVAVVGPAREEAVATTAAEQEPGVEEAEQGQEEQKQDAEKQEGEEKERPGVEKEGPGVEKEGPGVEKEAPAVAEFSLANQKLKLTSAEDAAEHASYIRAHPELKVIRLNGNTIGVEAAQALAEAVAACERIEEFYLNDCFTGRMKEEVHVAVEVFCRALKGKEHLALVDFSDNAFGPIGAKASSILISTAVSLQRLVINNCGLGPEGGKIIAQALLECQRMNQEAKRASSLRVIQMGRNRLENGSAPILSEALAAHGLLEEISFPQCGIRQEGIVALSCGLAGNPNLLKINLQDNTFTDQASLPLAKGLGTLKGLVHLDIGDCLVGAEGCKAIVEALVSGGAAETLEAFNLQYGEMDEEGALRLGQLLPKFLNLKVLMLNGNAFDPNGRAAMAIKDALQLRERADILDSWSDMDYEGEDDESGFEDEGEDAVEDEDSVEDKDNLDDETRKGETHDANAIQGSGNADLTTELAHLNIDSDK